MAKHFTDHRNIVIDCFWEFSHGLLSRIFQLKRYKFTPSVWRKTTSWKWVIKDGNRWSNNLKHNKPDIGPFKYSQLIFDKGAKSIQCSKDNFFQQIMLENMDIHMQKNESRHFHMNPYLEDNIGENLDDLGFGDDFLDTAPKAQMHAPKAWNK